MASSAAPKKPVAMKKTTTGQTGQIDKTCEREKEREKESRREIETARERARDTPTSSSRRGASHANLYLLRLLCSVYVYLLPVPLSQSPLPVKRIVLFGADALRADEGLFGDIDVLSVDVRVIEAVIKTLQGSGRATIRNSIVTLLQHIVWVCSRDCGICDTQLG